MKRIVLLILVIASIGSCLADNALSMNSVDSLYLHLKPLLVKNKFYYIGLKENKTENSQLISKLILDEFSVVGDKSKSDFTIDYSFQSRIKRTTKRSFLFSRTITQQEIDINARLTESDSELIKNVINRSITLPIENDEAKTSLWKPFVISLITGSLIYSLWVLE